MFNAAFNILLLLAVLVQASPVKACGVERVATGLSCHDQTDSMASEQSQGGPNSLQHCEEWGGPAAPADGETPFCIPCQPKSPVERQAAGPAVDFAPAPLPLVLFLASPVRATAAPVVWVCDLAASVDRVLPLLN